MGTTTLVSTPSAPSHIHCGNAYHVQMLIRIVLGAMQTDSHRTCSQPSVASKTVLLCNANPSLEAMHRSSHSNNNNKPADSAFNWPLSRIWRKPLAAKAELGPSEGNQGNLSHASMSQH